MNKIDLKRIPSADDFFSKIKTGEKNDEFYVYLQE